MTLHNPNCQPPPRTPPPIREAFFRQKIEKLIFCQLGFRVDLSWGGGKYNGGARPSQLATPKFIVK